MIQPNQEALVVDGVEVVLHHAIQEPIHLRDYRTIFKIILLFHDGIVDVEAIQFLLGGYGQMILEGIIGHLLEGLEFGFDLASVLHRELKHMQPWCHDDEPPHLQLDDGTDGVLNLTSEVEAVGHPPLLDVPAPNHTTLIDRHQQSILIEAIDGGDGDARLTHLNLTDLVVVLVDFIECPYQ